MFRNITVRRIDENDCAVQGTVVLFYDSNDQEDVGLFTDGFNPLYCV